jgi:hypothetical protein
MQKENRVREGLLGEGGSAIVMRLRALIVPPKRPEVTDQTCEACSFCQSREARRVDANTII